MALVRLDSSARRADELVKAEARKFDTASVFTLRMPGKSLTAITGLQDCTNLTDLSLCGNNITKMEGLEALEQLCRLDLSSNQIAEVSGIWHCTKLETLQLQDNLLADVKALHLSELQALPALKAVYLQNLDRSRHNSCCRQPGYKSAVLKALPNLKNLDGERCPHSINYAELAAEMEVLVSNPEPPKQLEVPPVVPWLEGAKEKIDLGPPHKDPELEKSGAELETALDVCQGLNTELQNELSKAQRLFAGECKTSEAELVAVRHAA